MTAEQLEELLRKLTQGECWKCNGTGLAYDIADRDVYEGYKLADKKPCPLCSHGREDASETLRKLAPSLARKVIAAEKLVTAVDWHVNVNYNEKLADAVAVYREASK